MSVFTTKFCDPLIDLKASFAVTAEQIESVQNVGQRTIVATKPVAPTIKIRDRSYCARRNDPALARRVNDFLSEARGS